MGCSLHRDTVLKVLTFADIDTRIALGIRPGRLQIPFADIIESAFAPVSFHDRPEGQIAEVGLGPQVRISPESWGIGDTNYRYVLFRSTEKSLTPDDYYRYCVTHCPASGFQEEYDLFKEEDAFLDKWDGYSLEEYNNKSWRVQLGLIAPITSLMGRFSW